MLRGSAVDEASAAAYYLSLSLCVLLRDTAKQAKSKTITSTPVVIARKALRRLTAGP